MQAIQTKYIGPTNSRGARIKAWCDAGQVLISYPYELSGQACHRATVTALVAKLGWFPADRKSAPRLIGGALPGRNGGYCFVFDDQWGDE